MSESVAEKNFSGDMLPALSATEKTVLAALWSWLQNHPGATLAGFEAAYRRAKGLAEGSSDGK